MRLAIISDIHGNLEAFQQVLADIERSRIDQVICLGDMIGYGPEPEEVIQLIQKENIPSIMGNHELAILEPRYLEWFNILCQMSLDKTKRLLSHETIHYIHALKNYLKLGEALFVHGSPPDSVMTYIYELSDSDLETLLQAREEKFFFVGHTHDLLLKMYDGNAVYSQPLSEGVFPLQENQKYLVNVGSVGQPRDGNNQAKYVIWDQAAANLEVRFVPYDIGRTVQKIFALGLPEYHARRLW
jgi:predicted phosphodiesterase